MVAVDVCSGRRFSFQSIQVFKITRRRYTDWIGMCSASVEACLGRLFSVSPQTLLFGRDIRWVRLKDC
jgi:hypothetical protein